MSNNPNKTPKGYKRNEKGELVKTYTGKELTGYLVGLIGQNIIYNIVATCLMYYFQSVIFLPAMAYSTIVAIARVWDAINDPMMGSIVDRTRSKWGKCKPYLLFVPPVVCVVTILTFINGMYTDYDPGSIQRKLIIGWAAVSYILWGMTYTAGDIPLWGVTSLMTEEQNDRAKILSWARIASNLGALGMLIQFLAPSLKPMFLEKAGGSDAKAYQYAFIFLAVIMTVFASILFQFAGFSVKEKVKQSKEKYTIKENFKIMWNCRPFRQILISGILRSPIQLLAIVALNLVMYFYFDNDPGRAIQTGGLLLLVKIALLAFGIFGGMIIGSAFTPKLANKFEKKSLYNFYSVIGAIPFFLVFILYIIFKVKLRDSFPLTIVLALIFFMASWAMGGLNVLQSVMIADCVDYEEYNHGIRPDGVFFSGQSFIVKLSAGIASIIMGVVYSIVQFSGDAVNKLNNALAAGTDTFATYNTGFPMAMFFLVSVPPAIGMILSAIPTFKYAMSDKEHTEMLEELIERRGDNIEE